MNIFGIIIPPGPIADIVNIVLILIKVAVVVGVALLHVAYATYFERKVMAHMQLRLGPREVGPMGLFQPFADGIKLFFKEDIIPTNADKPIFFLSPVIFFVSALTSLAVLPFFSGFVVADINIGLLFLLAMSSLGAYGIVMSGWSSDSKYAFLGGMRSASQVISYEISMGLSLVGVMILAGSLNLTDIVNAQQNYWFIIPQFLGFFIFIISALAETNRLPFDLPEAESELVAGYFTEYSGFRFAMFFLGEYTGMLVMSSMATLCFLGGWTAPFPFPKFLTDILPFLNYVPGLIWFLVKVYAVMFFYYWVRSTLPRYRYDQLMAIGWKVLIPLALVNIVITGFVKIWLKGLL